MTFNKAVSIQNPYQERQLSFSSYLGNLWDDACIKDVNPMFTAVLYTPSASFEGSFVTRDLLKQW